MIDIKDKLPPLDKSVLLLTDSGLIEGSLNSDAKYSKWDFIKLDTHGCGCCGGDDDKVLAWMEKPEHLKEKVLISEKHDRNITMKLSELVAYVNGKKIDYE